MTSAINVAVEGSVVDYGSYGLSVFLPADGLLEDLSLSINGSEPMDFSVDHSGIEAKAGKNYVRYQSPLSHTDTRPFFLTYGFVRIKAVGCFESSDDKIVLSTQDIPCLSGDDYQPSLIEQMLTQLLDTEEETVINWMFKGEEDGGEFSIIDAALREHAPKSLSSMVQLFESSIVVYESTYDFFRYHGFSKIMLKDRKLPARKIRKTGGRELLWMAKNPQVLYETPFETSIDYRGSYYLPREIETGVRVKSYDSYENRLVLGFLDELIAGVKAIYTRLASDVESIKSIEERLNGIKSGEYTLPALVLIRQYVVRESAFLTRLRNVISKLCRLKRKYNAVLPGVDAHFSQSPRRTKVFQEVKSYSSIYELILLWLKFGDFSLSRENLALHAPKIDKLYEYFVLFHLLCWFHRAGFVEDATDKNPIELASYSLESCYYSNEKRVANSYKLSRGNTHIRLYYQPVIYGDIHEEHGITLHRLSCSNINSQRPLDSYWTPDFLLQVHNESSDPEWHIFDAKFSKADRLWEGYPKRGIFTEVMAKYKMDVGGVSEYDKVASAWLLCGREKRNSFRFAELSSWVSVQDDYVHSGIATLTPSYSCLDDVLIPILGLAPTVPQTEPLDNKVSENEISEDKGLDSKNPENKPVDSCPPLIRELYDMVIKRDLLYDARWSQKNFGVDHPLLRKTAPKGREGAFYTKVEIDTTLCYAYCRLLPQSESRILSFIKKNRGDA